MAFGLTPARLLADCSFTTSGKTPLTDMDPGVFYKGFQGGLYPSGSSIRPAAHNAAGIAIGTSQIKPLDPLGKVNLTTGKIGFVAIGMSNTASEFGNFLIALMGREGIPPDPAKNPTLILVNGAIGGAEAGSWTDPNSGKWAILDARLAENGLTPKQVQVVWIKHAVAEPAAYGEFPLHAQALQDKIADSAKIFRQRYPNTKLAYLSTRIRSYSDKKNDLSPEPYAYENGFSAKWAIEEQINGIDLNFDPAKGPVVAPFLSWGPYLWADGLNPRSDGLVWTCSDFGNDFIHPSSTGAQKVVDQLNAFFRTDPTATPWFLKTTVTGQPPTVSATAAPSSGNDPLTVKFATVASDPGGGALKYFWTYDDGTYSLAKDPVKTFRAPGTYRARLTVNDADGNSAFQVITVTVGPGGGGGGGGNVAPVAKNQTVFVVKNTPKKIIPAATDGDGDPLSFSIVLPPKNGTLSGSRGSGWTYTPKPNFSGVDSFTFKASDGDLDSNIATVTIKIN
jgi:PKD repeat protein